MELFDPLSLGSELKFTFYSTQIDSDWVDDKFYSVRAMVANGTVPDGNHIGPGSVSK